MYLSIHEQPYRQQISFILEIKRSFTLTRTDKHKNSNNSKFKKNNELTNPYNN